MKFKENFLKKNDMSNKDANKLSDYLNKNRPEYKKCESLTDDLTCNSIEYCQWEDYEGKCEMVEYFSDRNRKYSYKKVKNHKYDFFFISIIFCNFFNSFINLSKEKIVVLIHEQRSHQH